MLIRNPVLDEANRFDLYYPPDLPDEITSSELYARAKREGWNEWIETPLDFEAMKNGYIFDVSKDVDGNTCYWLDGEWILKDGTTVKMEDEEDHIAYVGKADYFARFCEGFLKHTKGEIAGQPYRLLPWMRKITYALFGWVKNDKTKYRRFQDLYIAVPKKQGKALGNRVEIPTPTGWKNHGDLQVGDDLFDRNGNVCQVIAVHPKCDIDYEVEFTNGEKIRCNKEHLWVTESLINNKVWKTDEQPTHTEGCEYCGGKVYARKLCVKHYNRDRNNGHPTLLGKPPKGTQNRLNKGYYNEEPRSTEDIAKTLTNKQGALAHRIRMHDGLELPDIELPVDPWFLGYWLGDGHKNNTDTTVGDQDKEFFLKELSNVGMYSRATHDLDDYAVDFEDSISGKGNDNLLRKELTSLGVVTPQGTPTKKRIPKLYLRASRGQRLSLLQGLMDSDGTIDKTGKSLSFSQKNKELTEDVCELLASLGIKYSSIFKSKVCCNNGKTCFAYNVQFHAFRDEHPVFRNPRKLERMRYRDSLEMSTGRSRHVHIKSITKTEPVEGNCITVSSPDGTYLAGRTMLPTHNSAIMSVISIFCMYAEQIPKAYVYSCACDRNQARIIYEEAAGYVSASPELADIIGIIDSRSRLVHTASGSFYSVLSADSHRNDGIDSYCTLVDEIHRHKNRKLMAVMLRAGRARQQKLMAVITTYGPSLSDGSIWAEVHNEAKAQIEGKRPNSWRALNFIASAEPIPVILNRPGAEGATRLSVERLQQPVNVGPIEFDLSDFASVDREDFGQSTPRHKIEVVITKPAARYQTYIEVEPLTRDLPVYSEATANHDWQSDHAIRRANVAVDQIFSIDEIRKDIENSRSPEAQAETRQLSLNIVSGSGRKWISNAAWQGLTRMQVQPKKLIGRFCYAGFDGSFANDLTALVLAFPNWDRDTLLENVTNPRIDLLTFAWLPDHRLEEREDAEKMPYRYHSEKPYLIDGKGPIRITKGVVINYGEVAEDIVEICSLFEVRAIAYDPNKAEVIRKLEQEGLLCVAQGQGMMAMSPSIRKFSEFVYNGWLAHGSSAVLDRAVEGAQLRPPDDVGNTCLTKSKSVTRIDPLQAAVMAVGFCCSPPEDTSGAYSGRPGSGVWG